MSDQQDAPSAEPYAAGPAHASGVGHSEGSGDRPAADLDRIERDLADVEIALSRLADGTYFDDEVTGSPIPADVLESHPLARRAQ